MRRAAGKGREHVQEGLARQVDQQGGRGSDGLGAIYPGIMNSIIALRCLGYSSDDPRMIHAMDEFEALGIEEGETFRMQPCVSPVWDTAYALFALGEAGIPADDPRIVSTVYAIADELTVDGLVLRYRVKETDDGLEGEEGTFTICSFWLVSALVEIGDISRACQLCEKLLSFASPLGLYAEELDPHTGRHLGNFPQAFTHLALINALLHLIQVEQGMPPGQLGPLNGPAATS